MTKEEKKILNEILELVSKISKKSSESIRKVYLGQFINSFSFEEEINQIAEKIKSIPE